MQGPVVEHDEAFVRIRVRERLGQVEPEVGPVLVHQHLLPLVRSEDERHHLRCRVQHVRSSNALSRVAGRIIGIAAQPQVEPVGGHLSDVPLAGQRLQQQVPLRLRVRQCRSCRSPPLVPPPDPLTTVLVVPDGTREVIREDWEMEGRDAPHVDHVTDNLTGFLAKLTIG